MKKWILHTFACIINAASVITFLAIILYFFIAEPKGVSVSDIPLFLLFAFVITIYLLSDFWGIKLYNRYKTGSKFSFTERRILSAILFFHCIIQIGAGFLTIKILPRFFITIPEPMEEDTGPFMILGLCIITAFLSGVVLFITTILLTKAIKKNQIVIRDEIENIGNSDTYEV